MQEAWDSGARNEGVHKTPKRSSSMGRGRVKEKVTSFCFLVSEDRDFCLQIGAGSKILKYSVMSEPRLKKLGSF